MDGKVIVYGICLVAIIAGASFWSYTMGIDEAQKEAILARQQLAQAEAGIVQAQAWIAARKEAAALITASQIIESENQKLRDEVQLVGQDRTNLARSYLGSIQRAREESVGRVMPELLLTSGTSYKQASIQSLDSEITVLQHSGGVTKVPTTTLPEILLDRFKFGYSPGGVSAGSLVLEDSEPLTTSTYKTPSFGKASTNASDSLARLGMDDSIASPSAKKKVIKTPARDPNRIKTQGDPALWKNVQRSSIGRAYIPGQGWLRVGPDGPIPGSARK